LVEPGYRFLHRRGIGWAGRGGPDLNLMGLAITPGLAAKRLIGSAMVIIWIADG
jgi:hypothetical protein